MKTLFIILGLSLLPLSAFADWGLSYSLGQTNPKWHGSDNARAHRLALVYPIPMQDKLLTRHNLGINLELAYHYWQDYTPRDNHGVSLIPVLSYQYPLESLSLYFEGGIGITYIDSEHYLDRSLGSHWQFEDKLGAGVILQKHHKLGIAFNHYSNANLASENDGFNVVGLSYGYLW
ncbi:acyloxyacyl hydrolase [Shewanella halotolerans]|uniref:acyloxyacyl hydrolase n=1 Tax=Shewanella halotolerans TaxID=2864204 RepID=UPI001C65B509|nr:acyloxyacyl hydrolase [Shewanella halotolerans]QYJ90860.1 acyloxyacyl hydrolase [Shewanella halotolerans]